MKKSTKYYEKQDLIKLQINDYLDEMKLSEDEKKVIMEDRGEDEFVITDADIFRQGDCQLFAYVLNKKWKYKVYKIQQDKSFHIFCKSPDGRAYIDVRGITCDFHEFIVGLNILDLQKDISEEYRFKEDDFEEPYANISIAFAEALIESDERRYKLDNIK